MVFLSGQNFPLFNFWLNHVLHIVKRSHSLSEEIIHTLIPYIVIILPTFILHDNHWWEKFVFCNQSTGVAAQPEGKVHIENCDFYNCGGGNDNDDAFNSSAAVQLQQDSDTKPDATLIDNNIHNNSGYGVCIVRSVSQADENPECTINLDVTTNRFRGNTFGDVCQVYLDRSNND